MLLVGNDEKELQFTVENSSMSSTPGGMRGLLNVIGNMSSASTTQGKCWLTLTPKRSLDKLSRRVDARSKFPKRLSSCPKL